MYLFNRPQVSKRASSPCDGALGIRTLSEVEVPAQTAAENHRVSMNSGSWCQYPPWCNRYAGGFQNRFDRFWAKVPAKQKGCFLTSREYWRIFKNMVGTMFRHPVEVNSFSKLPPKWCFTSTLGCSTAPVLQKLLQALICWDISTEFWFLTVEPSHGWVCWNQMLLEISPIQGDQARKTYIAIIHLNHLKSPCSTLARGGSNILEPFSG